MIAEPQYGPDRYDRALAAIHTLLDELDLGRYALFHEVGEGNLFPDGSESMSGGVVTEHGTVFTFWTDWDAARKRPVFTTWKQIEPEPALAKSREYLDARAEVGLPPLLGEPYYARFDMPNGITHVLPEEKLATPEGAIGLLIALVFGAGRFLKFVRRKLP